MTKKCFILLQERFIKIKSLDIVINKTPYDESITGTRDEENEF